MLPNLALVTKLYTANLSLSLLGVSRVYTREATGEKFEAKTRLAFSLSPPPPPPSLCQLKKNHNKYKGVLSCVFYSISTKDKCFSYTGGQFRYFLFENLKYINCMFLNYIHKFICNQKLDAYDLVVWRLCNILSMAGQGYILPNI